MNIEDRRAHKVTGGRQIGKLCHVSFSVEYGPTHDRVEARVPELRKIETASRLASAMGRLVAVGAAAGECFSFA
jgi:hypothetical protein